jgi:hypothetical protein
VPLALPDSIELETPKDFYLDDTSNVLIELRKYYTHTTKLVWGNVENIDIKS